jgi:hypothetical protein
VGGGLVSKIKRIDFGDITTKARALSALRALGFSKASLQLTRGSLRYKHESGYEVTLTSHGSFIALDRTGGDWGCISNLTTEGQFHTLCDRLRAAGVLGDVAEINAFGLAVALAAAATQGRADA